MKKYTLVSFPPRSALGSDASTSPPYDQMMK